MANQSTEVPSNWHARRLGKSPVSEADLLIIRFDTDSRFIYSNPALISGPIQLLLGHRSLATTTRYLRIAKDNRTSIGWLVRSVVY